MFGSSASGLQGPAVCERHFRRQREQRAGPEAARRRQCRQRQSEQEGWWLRGAADARGAGGAAPAAG
jgi:hypothetical protein